MAGADEEREAWVSARVAVEYLRRVCTSDDDAQETIIDRAAGQMIQARCERMEIDIGWRGATKKAEQDVFISAAFWERFRDARNRQTTSWATGDFTSRENELMRPSMEHKTTFVRLYTVSFLESDLLKIPGVTKAIQAPPQTFGPPAPWPETHQSWAVPVPPVSAAERHPGGAPGKQWWDDLWVEIAIQLWKGDLEPETVGGKSFRDVFAAIAHDDLYPSTYGMMSESIHGSWNESMDWDLRRNADGTFSAYGLYCPADIRFVTPVLKFTIEPYGLWLERIGCDDDNLMKVLNWVERVNTALFIQFDERFPTLNPPDEPA